MHRSSFRQLTAALRYPTRVVAIAATAAVITVAPAQAANNTPVTTDGSTITSHATGNETLPFDDATGTTARPGPSHADKATKPVDPNDPAANLGANELIDLDGQTKELQGRVTFTNPRVAFVPDDEAHGPVLKITYDVSNDSNAWAASLGTANWGDRDKGWYSTETGEPMDFACNEFVPFAPKDHADHKVATCVQWREVTDAELEAGQSTPDSPYYDVLFGQDYTTGLWAESPAQPYPSVPVFAPMGWAGRDKFIPATHDHHHHHHGEDGDGHDHTHGNEHNHADGHDHNHGDGHSHDSDTGGTSPTTSTPAPQPGTDTGRPGTESSPTSVFQGAFRALWELFALISGGFGVFFTQLAGLSS